MKNQKNTMFDPLEDEISQMRDTEKTRANRLHKALRLSDSIQDLNYKEFILTSPESNLREAISLLKNNHSGCIIIADDNQISGIFTERDLLTKVVSENVDLDTAKIGDYMTLDPQTLRPSDPIAYALNRMTDGGYRHVPIVDEDEKPVGMVCMKTIVDYLGEYYFDEIMNLPPKPLRSQKTREDA